jgi:hypothetical protein
MLEQATILFLVIVFVTAELYRMRRGHRGLIVSVVETGVPLEALPALSVHVRLDDGREVTASLMSCTACLGRVQVGDEVRVSDTRDGWVVDLPWLRSRACKGHGGKDG